MVSLLSPPFGYPLIAALLLSLLVKSHHVPIVVVISGAH